MAASSAGLVSQQTLLFRALMSRIMLLASLLAGFVDVSKILIFEQQFMYHFQVEEQERIQDLLYLLRFLLFISSSDCYAGISPVHCAGHDSLLTVSRAHEMKEK